MVRWRDFDRCCVRMRDIPSEACLLDSAGSSFLTLPASPGKEHLNQELKVLLVARPPVSCSNSSLQAIIITFWLFEVGRRKSRGVVSSKSTSTGINRARHLLTPNPLRFLPGSASIHVSSWRKDPRTATLRLPSEHLFAKC